jgi:hypothetical protein
MFGNSDGENQVQMVLGITTGSLWARLSISQRNQPPAKPSQPFNMPSMSTAGRHCKLKTNLYRMKEKIRSMQFLTCIFEARMPTYTAS